MKNNWKNLQDLLFFQEGPGVRKNQFRNNGVKLLNVGNINDKKLNLDTTSIFISEEEAYGKYSHFLVENGDLLICCSGIVVDNFHNKIVFAEEKHLPLCLNTSTMRFRTLNDDILNIKYFYYFLMTKLFKEQLQKLITGSAQLNFGPSHIKKIFMPIVELNKQKQVAKTLDKAQELIDLRKDSIAKLDELAKSIFINMFGDPVSNPKGWEVRELDDVCEITSSKRVYKSDYVSEGIPFYKIKEIILKSKNIEPKEIEYISIDAFENFASKFGYPHEGDILVTAVGATIGYFYLVDDEKFYFKDGNLIWLRNYKMDINKKFLLYMFRTKEFKNKILELSKGAAQNALTIVKLKSVFICTPPIDLQNKFTSIIEKIEEQKSLYEKELEKLEENFQALLQQSFKE